MRSVIGIAVVSALQLSAGMFGSSALAGESCDVARAALDRLCFSGRRLSEQTQAGCATLATTLDDACDVGDAGPSGGSGPFVTAGFIELQDGMGVALPIEGGEVISLTDILANASDADESVFLFLAVQAATGGCEGPGDVPSLLLAPNQQLSVSLTTPIAIAADEQLCLFATSETESGVAVNYTLVGKAE